MKQVFKIDSEGFYVEPILLSDGEELPSDCVEDLPTQDVGFYKHKWDGEKWVEGLPQEEIEAIKNQLPLPTAQALMQETIAGMQQVDFFTLDKTSVLEDRTMGMQEIDDFALTLISQLQAQVDELKAEIETLKGGS